MIRVVAEFVLIVVIGFALFALGRRLVQLRDAFRPPLTAAQAPPEASWRAVHIGTEKNETEVLVVLQVAGGADVWDRRTCAIIDNQDPDYDKRLYNALEDARTRATLLNGLRDP